MKSHQRLGYIWSLAFLLCACDDGVPVNEMPDAWVPADPQMSTQPPLNPNPSPTGGSSAGNQSEDEGGNMGANQPLEGGVMGASQPPQGGQSMMGGMPGNMMAGAQNGGNEEGGQSMGGNEMLPPDPRINAGWIGGPCLDDGECPYVSFA